MQVAENQLASFIVSYGSDCGVNMNTINMIGIPKVLDAIDAQVNPRTSTFYGHEMFPVEETDAIQCLHDFFAESYGQFFDHWYSEQ